MSAVPGARRLAWVAAVALLCVTASAYAGGIEVAEPDASYDANTGVAELCFDMASYHYGHGGESSAEAAIMAFEVKIGARTAAFAWVVTDEVHPCVRFAMEPNLGGPVEIAYYHSLEFVDSKRFSFQGAQPVARLPAELQARVRKIQSQGGREAIKPSRTVLISATSVYLRLNGKTPGAEANVSGGVSKRPLVFSWFARDVPAAASIRYRYRLYPTQIDWSNWGTESSVTITYIPAGIHIFQVQSELVIHGVSHSIALAQHQFTIETPYVGPIATKGANSLRDSEIIVSAYPRKRALLLGVTSYRDPIAFQALPFVKKDVSALETELLRHGFAKRDIESTASPLTTSELQQKIRLFVANATDDEQMIIYLSGHGFTSGESDEIRALFAGSDCDRKTEVNCLSLNAVKEDLQAVVVQKHGPRHILLIVDACAAGQAVVAKGFTQERAAAASRGVQVVTAGTRGEEAREDPATHQSVFTRYLIEGLRGDADLITDKVITLSELMVWVRWKVAHDTAGQQTPSFARIKGTGEMMFDVPKP